MKVAYAARNKSKLDVLMALRDSIAKTIDDCESGRDMASLSKRLMEVIDEIEEIKASESPEPKNPLEEAQAKHGGG